MQNGKAMVIKKRDKLPMPYDRCSILEKKHIIAPDKNKLLTDIFS
jgi:hypothetical protein